MIKMNPPAFISFGTLTVIGLILVLLAVAGCRRAQPEPVINAACFKGSSGWQSLPDRDVTRSELSKIWRANRANYTRLRSRHAMCRKSVNAS